VYIVSLVLLAVAAVTLALGIQREGVGVLFLSIGCSVLAAASAGVAVVRRLRRGHPVPGA
jgi:hypothetical protein